MAVEGHGRRTLTGGALLSRHPHLMHIPSPPYCAPPLRTGQFEAKQKSDGKALLELVCFVRFRLLAGHIWVRERQIWRVRVHPGHPCPGLWGLRGASPDPRQVAGLVMTG